MTQQPDHPASIPGTLIWLLASVIKVFLKQDEDQRQDNHPEAKKLDNPHYVLHRGGRNRIWLQHLKTGVGRSST